MAVVQTWFSQDLQKAVKVNYIDGNLFSHNGNGNSIGVRVYNDCEPVTLTGTVSGYVITSDGSTVPCVGARSGNEATITIPPAAYQPGNAFITIFLTDGSTVTTLCAAQTTVLQARTGSQVSPGSVVQDWTQTINAAMQSVEDAAENLGGIIATPYASLTYPVPLGKYTYYNSNLYRCISPIETSEEFTAAHWTQVKLGDDVSDLKSALDEITVYSDDYTPLTALNTVQGKYVFNNTYNNKLNEATDATKAYKVFTIEKGKYKITGFGYDRYQFYMAVLGDSPTVMNGSSHVCNLIENIECGTSVYPSGYTYHTVEIEFETDGYLYVNYLANDTVGSCSKAKIAPITDPAIENKIQNISDSSLVHGLVKDGTDYYHFVQLKDTCIIRQFKRMNGNNLFQWAGIKYGTVDSGGVHITSTVINYDTDIIGPVDIFNTTLWPDQYGEWTGGNHKKTVNGVAYPTAEQESFLCLVNGAEVTNDGVYYGDVKFITTNNLYFPQSITGDDLTQATKAMTETREYSLDTQMHVRVRLDFVETTRVALYYGMQAVIANYDNVLFMNNEYTGSLPNQSNIDFREKEHEVIFESNAGLRLIVKLNDIGLGTFKNNDNANGYATLPAASNTRKLYYRLIDGASSHGFENGAVVAWEGTYALELVK